MELTKPDYLEYLEAKNELFAFVQTMEDKLDVAYEIYTKVAEVLEKPLDLKTQEKEKLLQLQDSAKKFMGILLNVKDNEKIIELAQKRKANKVFDSTYFPEDPIGLNKITVIGSEDASETSKKAHYQLGKLAILAKTLNQKKIMRVEDYSQTLDMGCSKVIFLPTPISEDRINQCLTTIIEKGLIIIQLGNNNAALDAYWQIYNKTNSCYEPKKTSLPITDPDITVIYTKLLAKSSTSAIKILNDKNDALNMALIRDIVTKYNYKENQTIYMTHVERAKNRIIISDGKFYQPIANQKLDANTWFQLCDTTVAYESHKNPGYASYTINQYGEISITSHFGMIDHIAHSSLNAGTAIFGRWRIKNTKWASN